MSYANNAPQHYLRNAVLTATPEQLHLMLYDAAIRFATAGREAIAARDREAAFHALDRAQKIVLELINGVSRGTNPALANQMIALYNFIYSRLIDANLEQDTNAIDDALRILRHQRETWVLLMEKLQTELGPGACATEPEPADSGSTDGVSRFVAEG